MHKQLWAEADFYRFLACIWQLFRGVSLNFAYFSSHVAHPFAIVINHDPKIYALGDLFYNMSTHEELIRSSEFQLFAFSRIESHPIFEARISCQGRYICSTRICCQGRSALIRFRYCGH